MGVWVLPNANSLDVIARVRAEIEALQTRAADGHARRPSRTTPRSTSTARSTRSSTRWSRRLHRHGRHLPVPRLAAHRAGAGRGDSGVAHRRRVPDAGVRLHGEPAHAAGDRARRWGSSSTTPSWSSRTSSATSARARRRSHAALVGARELVGPIIAMTITLAAVYAPIGFQGGLTGALFREFAFTLAGAVFISGVVALTLSPMMSSRLAQAERRAGTVRARDRPRRSRPMQRRLRARARRHAAMRAGASTRCGSCSRCWSSRCTCSPRRARAQRGPGRRLRRHRRARPTPRSSSSTPYTDAGRTASSRSTPEFDHSLPDHVPDGGLRRHAREALGRAQAQHLPDPGGARAQARGASPASARRRSLPPRAAGRRDSSRSSSSSPRRPATRSILRFAEQLAQEAMKSGSSPFRRSSTCEIDQAKTRDRHRSRQGRLDGPQHAAGGRGPGVDARRQLRQPLQHRRAQLQGDPADRARRAAHARAARRTSTSPGPAGSSMPLSAVATLQRRRRAAHAEPLPAAQRGEDLGRRAALARRRAQGARRRGGEDPARRAIASTTPASRGSCGKRAASSCPRWASRWC